MGLSSLPALDDDDDDDDVDDSGNRDHIRHGPCYQQPNVELFLLQRVFQYFCNLISILL